MARKHFLTQKELEEILNQSEEDETNIVLNENTKIVYIPPAKIDSISDEEDIDDEELMAQIDPNLEIAGEIELEHDSVNEDFAAPPQINADFSQKFSSEASFGVPNWTKQKNIEFNFDKPDESLVLPLEAKIVEQMSKSVLSKILPHIIPYIKYFIHFQVVKPHWNCFSNISTRKYLN